LYIVKYTASKLRSINLLTIHPSQNVNIIVGNNNAGKTSLIEGIYYCSTQKSFKPVLADTLIQNNENTLKLLLNVSKSNENIKIYAEKNLNAPNIVKINDKRVSTKILMLSLPCIALSFGSENIINQPSDQRRSFLDWGTFHVEPTHLINYKNYVKTLKQRNSVLKKGADQNLDYWSELVANHGMLVHESRLNYFNALKKQFSSYIDKLSEYDSSVYSDIKNTEIDYKQGWDINQSLKMSIDQSLSKDLALKYTSKGPHRADIMLTIKSLELKNISSMSTQIIISLLLVLSQAEVFHVKHGFKPIILIDDLFFGIDDKNLRLVINLLVGSKAQCFITAPDLYKEKIKSLGRAAAEVKMYEFVDGELRED